MTNPVLPADSTVANAVTAAVGSPPPMPTIAGSALLESRLLLARTRRALAGWLVRS